MNERLVEEMLSAVKSYFQRAVAPLLERVDALERAGRLKGEKGDRGEPGPAGKDAQVDMAAVRVLVDEAVAVAVAKVPAPRDGKDGKDGKDGAPGARGERGEPGRGEPGPAGKDAQVDMAAVRVLVDEAVAVAVTKVPAPRDGKDGKDGAPGERGEPGRDGRDGRDGEDGEDGAPGRDALQLEILSAIDPAKPYARGTFACHAGGLIRANRNTDPFGVGDKTAEEAGWDIVLDGIAGETEESLDDGRLIRRTTVYTSGRKLVRELRTSCIVYRGVWRENAYERGDVVTWGGSSWHCENATKDRPGGGSLDWKLMVKEGRPGKDGAPAGEPQAKPVVRV